jgi:putative spermidine/putrescine transport system ATP-binding protein
MALSDRVVVMNHGRAEQIGPPHEAYERPATAFVAHFLGKTNMLEATVEGEGEGRRVAIGDGTWLVGQGRGVMQATIRPEKIAFLDGEARCALSGTVKTRIFQGNHWLYQIVTPAGLVTVIRQNTGEAAPSEGATVRITWRSEDMSLTPNTKPTAPAAAEANP